MTETFDVISIGAVLIDMIAMVEKFPEKDGESFVHDFKMMPGGAAANVAVICSRLGLKTAFVGKMGKDDFGRVLLEDLAKENVHTEKTVSISEEDYTGSCYICVDKQGERMILAHSGAANKLTYEDLPIDLLLKAKWIHLSDLKNFSAVQEFLAKNNNICFSISPGALIAENPKEAMKLMKKADLIIGSLHEITSIFRVTEKKLEKEINSFIEQKKDRVVVVTQGRKGAKIFSKKQTIEVPSFNVSVKDTTGAGDAFVAGMLYALSNNKDIEEAGRIATACSAICIKQIGARSGPKTKEELMAFLKENSN